MRVFKTILVSGVLLLIGLVVLNQDYKRLSDLPGKGVDQAPGTESVPFQQFALSSVTLLSDMRANGWLPEKHSEWFVSPTGQKNGLGTIASPFDPETAFTGGNKRSPIRAGDIVWLRGGTYRGSFTVRVAGKQDAPIHFRQYPGERVIFDKAHANRRTGTLNVRSRFVWFWDFEVINTFPDRGRLDADNKLNPWRGSGINVWAPDTKYINLVIRDNGHGFGLWDEEGGTEIYGCLIFNNGNNKKEHGVYAHNKTGTQKIVNNLIFNNAGYGLHIYANSTKGSTSGFDIDRNVVFNNGALMFKDQVADQILVGSVEGVPAERIRIRENVIYNFPAAPTSKNRGIRLGYRDQGNRDVELTGNLIVSKVPLKILWWKSVKAIGNTIITSGKSVEIQTPPEVDLSNYRFASNNFLRTGNKTPVFVFNQVKLDAGQWRRTIKHNDTESYDQSVAKKDRAARILLNLNKYDRTRADLVIYNPEKTQDISVKLNEFLQRGVTFEIRDAQDYFGKPVLRGVFDGNPVILRMNAVKITPPVGQTEKEPQHTESDFGVFVIRKVSNRQKELK